MAAILAFTAIGAYLSYEEFHTPNFISVLYGMARVYFSDNVCIEISNHPLILMTRNNSDGHAAIKEYMMLHGGYTVKEQLGAFYIFENESSKISVSSDQKIYWKIWEIGEPKPKKN